MNNNCCNRPCGGDQALGGYYIGIAIGAIIMLPIMAITYIYQYITKTGRFDPVLKIIEERNKNWKPNKWEPTTTWTDPKTGKVWER